MVCVVHIVCMDMCFYLPVWLTFQIEIFGNVKRLKCYRQNTFGGKRNVSLLCQDETNRNVRACRNDAALETGRKYRG